MRIVLTIDARWLNDPRVVAALARGYLQGVVAYNRIAIRRGLLPGLYESGVRYAKEPWAGLYEEFADALTVYRRGWGDCDDLTAWRVAELQESGEQANVAISFPETDLAKSGRGVRFHAIVRRADGSIEDPSRKLGMGRKVA